MILSRSFFKIFVDSLTRTHVLSTSDNMHLLFPKTYSKLVSVFFFPNQSPGTEYEILVVTTMDFSWRGLGFVFLLWILTFVLFTVLLTLVTRLSAGIAHVLVTLHLPCSCIEILIFIIVLLITLDGISALGREVEHFVVLSDLHQLAGLLTRVPDWVSEDDHTLGSTYLHPLSLHGQSINLTSLNSSNSCMVSCFIDLVRADSPTTSGHTFWHYSSANLDGVREFLAPNYWSDRFSICFQLYRHCSSKYGSF